MSKFKTPHPEEFCYISVTQFISQSTQQDLKYDVGWDFDEVEGCARAFIVDTVAMLAKRDPVSEVGGAGQWKSLAGLAVGTVHEHWLSV